MALNVQNKNFLGLLHKLDIDISRFTDKTFDGLFYNTPDDINYFLNWFMENISPDNTLTNLEQVMYFELEKNHSLSSEEEIDGILSSCDFTYEELNSLDLNYFNSLTERLEELKNDFIELNDISSSLESNHSEVKKKGNKLKEELNIWKKQLNSVRNKCSSINLLYGNKLDEANTFLLEVPCVNLDLSECNSLCLYEKDIFEKLNNNRTLKIDFPMSEYLTLLPKLEDDLACVETYLVYSEGYLKDKEARIAVLSDSLQKSSQQKSFCDTTNYSIIQFQINNPEDDLTKISKDMQFLEMEVYKKAKVFSHHETQKVLAEYLLKKIDLKNSYIAQLTTCQSYLKLNRSINSVLLQILSTSFESLENTLQTKKALHSRLRELERISSNDLSNLEMRNQRFKEISDTSKQHPLVIALKNILKLEENFHSNEDALKKVTELLSNENSGANFISHKFRIDLKSRVKLLLDNELCGPTNQLLFVPVELLIKYHKCEESEADLSRKIKRLGNKYVETKEYISKSDRKKLLAWIDLLIHPEALQSKVKN